MGERNIQTRSSLKKGLLVVLVTALFVGSVISAGPIRATVAQTMSTQDNTAAVSTGMPMNKATSLTKNPSQSVHINPTSRRSDLQFQDIAFDQGEFYEESEPWAGYTSDTTIGYTCQDDFWDVGVLIGGVEWFGLDYAWYGSGPTDPAGQLFEIIFKDTNGATVADFTDCTPDFFETGTQYDGWGAVWDYQYALPSCVTLGDGWVEIYSYYAPDIGNLLWVVGPTGNNNGQQNGGSVGVNFAFNLYGCIGPEDDVGVKKIDAPTTGLAGIITPTVEVKNYLGHSEYSVPVGCNISKKIYTDYLTEDFEEPFPPLGWTVQTDMGAPWQRNDYWGRPNMAGTGFCADADVDASAQYPMLTNLITPVMDLSTATGVALDFDSFEYVFYNDFTKVDITTDGGNSWTNLWQIVNSYKYGVYEHVNIDLSDYSGFSAVQLRFSYWAPYFDYYWEIDNVRVSTFFLNLEYNQTTYVDVGPVETVYVSFPDWTPADLGLSENMYLEYQVTAQTMLADDDNPNNNVKEKQFSLHYGFFNDVAVVAINSPVSGVAEEQTPEVAIANNGQDDENVSVNVVISKITYGAQWATDGTDAWSQQTSNYAGGVSPEATLSWSFIQNDYAYLQSAAIDTTAESTLMLLFRSMINWYSDSDINCKVLIRATDSDPWSDITPWSNPITGSINASQYSLDVTAFKGTATSVQFEFTGYYFDLNYWYVDDFGLGTYYTDFSGVFPPRTTTLMPEYNSTVAVDVASGETENVTFPEWIPADIPTRGALDYQIDATVSTNPEDENPIDNSLTTIISLLFEHDVGVTNITEPESEEPGTYSIEGTVENLGVVYTENDIPAEARITHVDNDTVIYDHTATIPGPLAPGQSAPVEFPDVTIANLTAWEGWYKIEIWTALPGDDHPENDKTTIYVGFWVCDCLPPETHYNISGIMGLDGWYVSDVILTAEFYDPSPPIKDEQKPASGVNHSYYKLHEIDPWSEYLGTPVDVSTDGFYELYYYSVDHAGNAEDVKGPFDFKIDKTPPTINLTVLFLNHLKTKWLLYASVDDPMSHVAYVEFFVDDAEVANISAPAPFKYEYQGDGKVAQAIAYDNAGNSGMSEQVSQSVPNMNSQSMPATDTQQNQGYLLWILLKKTLHMQLD